jgi:hypothetical protein
MPRKTFRKKYGKRKSSRRNYKQRRSSLKKRGGTPLIDFLYAEPPLPLKEAIKKIDALKDKCNDFTIKYQDGHDDEHVPWQTIKNNITAYYTQAPETEWKLSERPQNITSNCS